MGSILGGFTLGKLPHLWLDAEGKLVSGLRVEGVELQILGEGSKTINLTSWGNSCPRIYA